MNSFSCLTNGLLQLAYVLLTVVAGYCCKFRETFPFPFFGRLSATVSDHTREALLRLLG